MPNTTSLEHATAMIENAWGQPIAVLETFATRHPVDDPLLRSAMHIRSALVITENSVAVYRDGLHALSRPGYVPDFYELKRVTDVAADLRVTQAESSAYLQAIRRVVEAREAAAPTAGSPVVRLAQAAVARSGHTPPVRGPMPGPPAAPAVAGPSAPSPGARH